MIGRVVGALFGAEMQRQRGQNGLKGAAMGVVATSVLRRMGPLGMLIGGAYVAKKALDRRRQGRDPA